MQWFGFALTAGLWPNDCGEITQPAQPRPLSAQPEIDSLNRCECGLIRFDFAVHQQA